MLWFHRLQQRLSMTRNEALTLIALSVLFSGGLVVRYVQQNARPVPPNAYDESDRLFFEQSAALRAADSTGPFQGGDSAGILHGSDSAGILLGSESAGTRVSSGDAFRNAIGGSHPIDLNSATAAELERLPRIGPAMARRIVEFRSEAGAFHRVEDLLEIRGIGPKTLEILAPLVAVRPAADSSGPN